VFFSLLHEKQRRLYAPCVRVVAASCSWARATAFSLLSPKSWSSASPGTLLIWLPTPAASTARLLRLESGPMIDPAEFQRRGLYDPESPNAEDRLALLRWLEEHGVSLEEMVDASKRSRLPALLADRVIRPGDRFERAELAARAGIPVQRVEKIRRAVGFAATQSDVDAFTEGDVKTLRVFEAAAAFFGDRPAFEFSRTLGNALARVAEAAISLFSSNVEGPLMTERPSELDLAKANLDATQLLDMVPSLMDNLFRVHVEEAIRRSQDARRATHSYDTAWLAVGFVDLVGFTPLSQQLSVRELAALVNEFEGRAFDVASDHAGRVVKLIGDEVMFVAPSASAGCQIAIAIAESCSRSGAVRPRGGLATGEILTRSGDYYGPIVNLASRIADLAIPHEILVTAQVRADAQGMTGSLLFEPAGRRMLKGFDEAVELFSVTQA